MKRAAILCLAAVALVAATLAIWHWRFVAVPDALPETRLADPLVGWSSFPNHQHQVAIEQGEALLRLEKKTPKDKTASIGVWFGPLNEVRFIRIRCESRWENVELGSNHWNLARFVVFIKDHNGRVIHPWDSVIFAGSGSSEWRTDEVVLELTGDMTDTGLQFAMLGKTGLLEVRKLSIVAVKQRSWVPVSTLAVVLGWLALCTSIVRQPSVKPAWWRAFATASIIIAVSWITVFPQTKGILRSSAGGFAIGDLPAPPVVVARPATTFEPPSKPPGKTPPPVAANPPSKPPTPAVKPVPEPAQRQSGSTHKLIRESDKRFRLVHLALFAGFTFVVLLITGQGRQWPLPLAVAILSELVPALIDHIGDWNDWTDLSQNIAGVALAIFVWYRFLERSKSTPVSGEA